jgi:StAR-related lipid transfer protein 10
MQVGEVRVAEDADFERLRDLCRCHDGWKVEYNKNTTTVWTKSNEISDFRMIKIFGTFNDVSAATVFDVLNDPVYRKKWDFNMIEAYEICQISPNNDIGYYAMKVPKPLKNRDFVTQRSWLDLGKEYMIFNHSVNHAALPPKKNFVRGVSYLTGYHVVPTGESCDLLGTTVTYITQSDPRGRLPAWAVNKAAQILAPKVMSKLYKACKNYVAWKSKHDPHFKPWIFPEQNTLPKLNADEILSIVEATGADMIDETDALEETVEEELELKIPEADD